MEQERAVGSGARWAVVLAAGDGRRLRDLTVDAAGRRTPKQFCSVAGGPTLLEQTLRRGTEAAGARTRVVTVVAAQHAAWWRHDTRSLPADNVVVQPHNRGTAAGVLLPLLRVARNDPRARVVILPSDHFVEREEVLLAAIRTAFEAVDHDPASVVLLGIRPSEADPELGWIVPARCERPGVARVERFVEKPPAPVAAELLRRGGLWNAFILVASAEALIRLYRSTEPALLERLLIATAREATDPECGGVDAAYAGIEIRDFSRDVLESGSAALRVLPVPPCGWSDLGTPERLARCARRLAPAAPRPRRALDSSVAALGWRRPVLAAVV